MAIRYYQPGEHGSGFVGFRVTVFFNRDYRQKYFSTKPAKVQDESDPYVRYQKLKAQLQEAEWQAESVLYQYQIYVTQDHPTTGLHRGVGCHGIICCFFRNRRGNWDAAFQVQKRSGRPRRFTFATTPFSKVWERAVTFWGQEQEIEQEDVQRLLRSPPEPSQFKLLRRSMNERLKNEIPVEALSPVFAEQRDRIVREKTLEKASSMKLTDGLNAPNLESLEEDMMAWFEAEA